MSIFLLSGLMAIPVLGALVATVMVLYLLAQVLSKSANRAKDFGILVLAFFLYFFAFVIAVLNGRGDTATMLITMSVMLFAVSYWTLSKMKAFLFSPT
ncbi:hypothetical protein NHH82_12335 [Oxalobacteraceae bacterium OTU3REALA1]|nr:hypothetical protein NHH82_12335 [Oxalobacteraceae bacterium OTU3REALA1]